MAKVKEYIPVQVTLQNNLFTNVLIFIFIILLKFDKEPDNKKSKVYIEHIDKEALIERLKYSMTKIEVIKLANSLWDLGVKPDQLMDMIDKSNNVVGFHIAWVIENMLTVKPVALDYYLPLIIEKLPSISNQSIRRHFTKLIVLGTHRISKGLVSRVFEKEFYTIDLEPLEETCFKWFVDENSKLAVKANSLEILYFLSQRQKWIALELPQIIENQMEFGSPGLKAKARKVLKLLSSRK